MDARARIVSSTQGFTLIELLVVIALLAVLAAVVAPNLLGKAGDANRQSAGIQLEKVAGAIELYRLETGQYPKVLQDLVTQPADLERWRGPYLRKRALLEDPWGYPLVFRVPGQHDRFDLLSLGADGKPGGVDNAADIGHWE